MSSKKGVLQECHLSVSRQGVPQVGLLENVLNKYCFCSSTYVSAFGFVGFNIRITVDNCHTTVNPPQKNFSPAKTQRPAAIPADTACVSACLPTCKSMEENATYRHIILTKSFNIDLKNENRVKVQPKPSLS